MHCIDNQGITDFSKTEKQWRMSLNTDFKASTHVELYLNIRQPSFIVQVNEHWPKDIVKSQSLDITHEPQS